MKIQCLALAQKELDDAVDWYNEQATGLGRKFLDEVDRAVRRIVSFPMSCPEIEPEMRRTQSSVLSTFCCPLSPVTCQLFPSPYLLSRS